MRDYRLETGLLPEKLNLGNMQTLYSSFYRVLFEYHEFHRLQYYTKKIDIMKERIAQYEESYRNLNRQKVLIDEQFKLSKSQYARDSLLNTKGILSSEEHENSKSQYLQGALSLENIYSTLHNTEIQLTQMHESLLDTEFQYEDKKNTLETQLKTYVSQLLSEIQAWEQTYVFVSPIDGKVTFTTYWKDNQNITGGEVVFTVVPPDKGVLLGKAFMPMDRSGKVKIGQKTNIRFVNYPTILQSNTAFNPLAKLSHWEIFK